MQFILRAMQLTDLDQVMYIERESFPTPWSTLTYVYEIKQNPTTFMGVIEAVGLYPAETARPSLDRFQFIKRAFARKQEPQNAIVAYGGVWVKRGEAHISTIASHSGFRGRGIGELMLVALLGRGFYEGASFSALEVRISNTVAQRLYTKYGYLKTSVLSRYYHDNAEDAYLMKIPALNDAYLTKFQENVAQLRQRINFKDQFSGLQLEQCNL